MPPRGALVALWVRPACSTARSLLACFFPRPLPRFHSTFLPVLPRCHPCDSDVRCGGAAGYWRKARNWVVSLSASGSRGARNWAVSFTNDGLDLEVVGTGKEKRGAPAADEQAGSWAAGEGPEPGGGSFVAGRHPHPAMMPSLRSGWTGFIIAGVLYNLFFLLLTLPVFQFICVIPWRF